LFIFNKLLNEKDEFEQLFFNLARPWSRLSQKKEEQSLHFLSPPAAIFREGVKKRDSPFLSP